jgi:hypothetical protein
VRLESEHGTRGDAHPAGELLPRGADVGRRVAVVEQQELAVRRREQPARVFARLDRDAAGVDGLLDRLDAEQLGELADRAPVRDPGRDVRPLARVRALGEEPPELVKARGPRGQDPVRVVIDRRELAQYFSK